MVVVLCDICFCFFVVFLNNFLVVKGGNDRSSQSCFGWFRRNCENSY